MSESEVWRDIAGYNGRYQVSNKGNVYSVERMDVMGREQGGVTLKPRYDKDGYLRVTLCKNGKLETKKIHRLVTETFIPNPNGFPEVNHIDEVKTNNNVENLEWCTSKYNSNHGTRTKRLAQAQSKKVRGVNIETGEVLAFSSTSEAGDKGYSQGHVSSACKGVYKSSNGKLIGGGNLYRGHQWSYEEEK